MCVLLPIAVQFTVYNVPVISMYNYLHMYYVLYKIFPGYVYLPMYYVLYKMFLGYVSSITYLFTMYSIKCS